MLVICRSSWDIQGCKYKKGVPNIGCIAWDKSLYFNSLSQTKDCASSIDIELIPGKSVEINYI